MSKNILIQVCVALLVVRLGAGAQQETQNSRYQKDDLYFMDGVYIEQSPRFLFEQGVYSEALAAYNNDCKEGAEYLAALRQYIDRLETCRNQLSGVDNTKRGRRNFWFRSAAGTLEQLAEKYNLPANILEDFYRILFIKVRSNVHAGEFRIKNIVEQDTIQSASEQGTKDSASQQSNDSDEADGTGLSDFTFGPSLLKKPELEITAKDVAIVKARLGQIIYRFQALADRIEYGFDALCFTIGDATTMPDTRTNSRLDAGQRITRNSLALGREKIDREAFDPTIPRTINAAIDNIFSALQTIPRMGITKTEAKNALKSYIGQRIRAFEKFADSDSAQKQLRALEKFADSDGAQKQLRALEKFADSDGAQKQLRASILALDALFGVNSTIRRRALMPSADPDPIKDALNILANAVASTVEPEWWPAGARPLDADQFFTHSTELEEFLSKKRVKQMLNDNIISSVENAAGDASTFSVKDLITRNVYLMIFGASRRLSAYLIASTNSHASFLTAYKDAILSVALTDTNLLLAKRLQNQLKVASGEKFDDEFIAENIEHLYRRQGTQIRTGTLKHLTLRKPMTGPMQLRAYNMRDLDLLVHLLYSDRQSQTYDPALGPILSAMSCVAVAPNIVADATKGIVYNFPEPDLSSFDELTDKLANKFDGKHHSMMKRIKEYFDEQDDNVF